MKYLIIILLLFPIGLYAFSPSKLSMAVVDDINEKCKIENTYLFGCFWRDSNTIYLADNLSPYQMTKTLLHEIGHYYAPKEKDEIFADNFAYWSAWEILGVKITQPYVRFYHDPDVYDFSTGQRVTFEEAVRDNIWNKIQDLPFTKPSGELLRINF